MSIIPFKKKNFDTLFAKYEKLLTVKNNEAIFDKNPNVTIAFIGEFNSGKSSLINALLGNDLLPTDIFQTTATINRVTYGPIERLEIIGHNDEVIARYDNISQLKEFNADKGDFKNIKWIKLFSPSLKEGLELIDTPGFNDPDPIRDKTFLSILPTADAIVLVGDVNQALKGSEIPYIRDQLFGKGISNTIFIFNSCDTLPNLNELDKLKTNITSELLKLFKEIADFYKERGYNSIADTVSAIDPATVTYFTSAYAGANKPMECDDTLKNYLKESFNKLKERIFDFVSLRATLEEARKTKWLLNNLLNKASFLEYSSSEIDSKKTRLEVQKEKLENRIYALSVNLKNKSSELTKIMKSIEPAIRQYVAEIRENLVKRASSVLTTPGFSEDVYKKEIRAAIDEIIQKTNELVLPVINKPIELDTSEAADLDKSDFTKVLSKYTMPVDQETMVKMVSEQQSSGLMSNMAGGLGSIMAFAMGHPLVGVAVMLYSAFSAYTSQQKATTTISKSLQQAKTELNNMLSALFNNIESQLIEASYQSLKIYSKEVLKSASSIQWDIIEFCKNIDSVHSQEDNVRQLEQLKIAVNDCKSYYELLLEDFNKQIIKPIKDEGYQF